MKGLVDEPTHTIDLLGGGVTLDDVIDGHIYEQALEEKSAFAVCDLGAVARQHGRWQSTMGGVRPFYPLRGNSTPALLELLAALGTGFICSNKAEVSAVLDLGVAPDDIIVSGACKQLSLLRHAARLSVDHLVCDSATELCKIARSHPNAKVLLQLSTEAQAAETSMLIGCSLKTCRHLLESARDLGVKVVGVTFQIPSSKDLQAYSHALSDARCVFDMGAELGFNMTLLDVGGGFPGSDYQLQQVEATMRPLLDACFPAAAGVQVVAEPGSFYVSSAVTLAVNVIAKETVARDWSAAAQEPSAREFLYYLSDGVYGSFSSRLLGGSVPPPAPHKGPVSVQEPVFPSCLRGPSCDQLDLVVERCLLPELSPGDWLLFPQMGACGLGSDPATDPAVYLTLHTADWYAMQEAGVALDSMKNFSLVQYSL